MVEKYLRMLNKNVFIPSWCMLGCLRFEKYSQLKIILIQHFEGTVPLLLTSSVTTEESVTIVFPYHLYVTIFFPQILQNFLFVHNDLEFHELWCASTSDMRWACQIMYLFRGTFCFNYFMYDILDVFILFSPRNSIYSDIRFPRAGLWWSYHLLIFPILVICSLSRRFLQLYILIYLLLLLILPSLL